MNASNIVVIGVAGCGKSRIGADLARALHRPFIEGDQFHPPENIARMSAGMALDDQHRQGWLATLASKLADARASGQYSVLACSALKRRYRDQLRQADPDITFIHLAGTPALIATRLQQRTDHFMPASLLASQFAALEPPAADEKAISIDIDQPADAIIRAILLALSTDTTR